MDQAYFYKCEPKIIEILGGKVVREEPEVEKLDDSMGESYKFSDEEQEKKSEERVEVEPQSIE